MLNTDSSVAMVLTTSAISPPPRKQSPDRVVAVAALKKRKIFAALAKNIKRHAVVTCRRAAASCR